MTVIENVSSGMFLLITFVLAYYCLNRARTTDWRPHIRSLPGVIAIEECVGRSVEMGKPLLVTPGATGSLQGAATGPSIISGITILGYVASLCARTGAKLISTVHASTVIPLVEDVIETAYRMEGIFNDWKPENIRFLGGSQQSFTSGHMGVIAREKPAAQICCGYFSIATVTIAEAGKIAGCIQIGGNTNVYQLPYLVAAFDYWLIGEELLAAGAQLSKEPVQLATIFAEDVIKYLVIGIIILGSVISTTGTDFFVKLLSM